MEREDWYAALVASARATAHEEDGVLVIDGRTGRVLGSTERAAAVIGAPIPSRVRELVEQGLIARPDLEALRSHFAQWRAGLPDDTRETATSLEFDLRVHPPGGPTRLVHVEAVHHIRFYLDAEVLMILLRATGAADQPDAEAEHASWTGWTLYDVEMRTIVVDVETTGGGAVPDPRPTLGVLGATLLDPDDLPRILPSLLPTFEGRTTTSRYSCDYLRRGLAPLRLDCTLRVVAGSGPPASPDRRYLVVGAPAAELREAIVLGRLTPRQAEAVVGVFGGRRPQQLAAEQGVGVGTIRFHLAGAYRELGVTGRDELVARYHPPTTLVDDTTVTILEEDGERFSLPSAPPGRVGSTERRRLVGLDGPIEVGLTTWSPESGRRPIPAGLLSPREAQVVSALFEGLRPLAIAERQGVSVKAVRKRLSSAYAKLGVTGQAELVARYGRPTG